MLDHDHGHALALDLTDQADADLQLGGIEPGEPLVEQEQPGPGGQRPRELDALLVDVGELRADELLAAGQPDALEQEVGVPGGLGGRGRVAAERPAQHHVLARGHAREDPHELEGAGHPRPAHPERRGAEDLAALQPDRAGIGRDLTGDEIEDGGLAGAVRADDAHDGAGGDVEVEIGHREQAPERLAEAADPQQEALPLGHHAGALRNRSSQRTTPPGR